MKYKGVIFDFNGVIVDDYPLQKEAWDKISHQLRGRDVSDSEMIQNICGVPTENIIRWMSGKNLDENEIRGLMRKKEEQIKQLYLSSPLYKLNSGLEIILEQLKKKKILRTIATSSNFDMTMFSFKKLKLKRWFDFKYIVYNDGKHEGKPDPGPYILAAHKMEVEPKECVVFEDAKSGIISAFRAGVKKIIVVGSDDRLKTLKNIPGVTHVIHDFSEISFESIFS